MKLAWTYMAFFRFFLGKTERKITQVCMMLISFFPTGCPERKK